MAGEIGLRQGSGSTGCHPDLSFPGWSVPCTELLHVSSQAFQAGQAPAQFCHLTVMNLSRLVRPLHSIVTCWLSSFPGWSGPCTVLLHVGSQAFQAGQGPAKNCYKSALKLSRLVRPLHSIVTIMRLSLHQYHFVGSKAFQAGQSTSQNCYMSALKLSRIARLLNNVPLCYFSSFPVW